jgi:hypothetical protein
MTGIMELILLMGFNLSYFKKQSKFVIFQKEKKKKRDRF